MAENGGQAMTDRKLIVCLAKLSLIFIGMVAVYIAQAGPVW